MSKRIKGITIEIDGNTKGLDKALSGVNKESNKLQRELKDVEKLLKFNPGNTELLAQKQKLLGDQVATTREKLDTLKSAQDDVNKAFQNGEISEEQYRGFQREIAETEGKLKNFESQLEQSQGKLDKFGEKFQKAGEKVKAGGEKITAAGKTMTTNVTAPIVAAGGVVSKFAIDQEKSFAKVSTLLTGSSKDYEQYKKDIRSASSDMGVSFDEYAESVYGSISAGVEQGEAIKFTGDMVKLAKGGFTDTATAVDVVTTSLNAYGMETSEATRVADMLVTTQNLGKTTVDELASSMGAVIPAATAQNVSLEELNAGYATLTKNGIGTSEAGTMMKAMFSELGKAGSKTDKILREKTGKSFSELQESGMNVQDALSILKDEADASGLKLGDLFGSSEAASAALTIAGAGAEDFSTSLEAMNDSAGATEEAFEKMNNTTGQKMQEALVKMQNAAAQLGDVLLPFIAKAAEYVAKLADKFANLSPTAQKTILVVAGIAAAIGPLLIIIGTLMSSIGSIIITVGKVLPYLGKLKTAFTAIRTVMLALTGPIGIAIAVITALGILIYKNWDTIKAKTIEVWNALRSGVSTAVNGVRSVVSRVFGGIKALITNPIETAKNTVLRIIDAIKGAFSKMNITIPKPKLPKVSVSMGSKEVAGVSIPFPKFSVDWYKKGGVFGGPSIIGVGEEPGVSEAVIPLKPSVLSQIGKGIADSMGGGVGGGTIEVPVYLDGYMIAKAVQPHVDMNQQSRTNAKSYMKGVGR
ncbi:putative tail tape measure protein [Exiguobacterium phage vB_EauS-123]|nr:putative tail tape measure protein [Exiguobacterium phage vB_EauS-123]